MSSHPHPSTAELESILRFYAEAGVDCLLEDAPVDRLAEAIAAVGGAESVPVSQTDAAQQPGGPPLPAGGAPRARTTPPATAARPTAEQIAVPDENAMLDARAAAAEAASLEALKAALDAFTGCNLRYSARSAVFADGNPEADIMFVGEAPGREEDIQGLPFVGRAGQLLDRMMAAIGLDRQSAYIANVIPWRPPGNRNPTPHEIELCRPFIERHIALAGPKLVVFLGNVSNKAMMNTNRGILSVRGTWGEYALGERKVPAMPTLHPAYLLRNPAHKRLAWQDLLEIRAKLDEIAAAS